MDTFRAAIARALAVAAERAKRRKLGRVRIFSTSRDHADDARRARPRLDLRPFRRGRR